RAIGHGRALSIPRLPAVRREPGNDRRFTVPGAVWAEAEAGPCDHDPPIRSGRKPDLVVKEVTRVRIGHEVRRTPGPAAVRRPTDHDAGDRTDPAEGNVRVIGGPIRTEGHDGIARGGELLHQTGCPRPRRRA